MRTIISSYFYDKHNSINVIPTTLRLREGLQRKALREVRPKTCSVKPDPRNEGHALIINVLQLKKVENNDVIDLFKY